MIDRILQEELNRKDAKDAKDFARIGQTAEKEMPAVDSRKTARR